jgi:hypothetical protein
MSNQWDDTDDEFEYDDQTGNDPGNLVKTLRKQLKTEAAEKKALNEQLSKLSSQVRESTIGSIVKSRGLPDKVARIIPKDIDPSEEEVTKWLDEYGDVFGMPKEESNAEKTAELTDNQAAMQQMNRVASTGTAPGGNAQETLAALNSPELTEDQLIKMIEKGGVF